MVVILRYLAEIDTSVASENRLSCPVMCRTILRVDFVIIAFIAGQRLQLVC